MKQIWERMEQLYTEDERIKPTIRTVNSIIQSHTKQIQECVESNRDYDTARNLAKEAEGYLDLMKKRYEETQDPDHMPDVMTYTSVMVSFWPLGRPKKSIHYLLELKYFVSIFCVRRMPTDVVGDTILL